MTEHSSWPAMRDNPGELAAVMLGLVDRNPDRLGIVEVPHDAVRTVQDVRLVEEVVRREFARGRRERPQLGIEVRLPTANHPNAVLLVAVHEHQWIGGHCIHGCHDRPDP